MQEYPKPTERDYTAGTYVRYFLIDRRDSKIYEVGKTKYANLKSSNFVNRASVNWNLTGPVEDTKVGDYIYPGTGTKNQQIIDQLYQAYLNACFFMLGNGTKFKMQQSSGGVGPGFPDRTSSDSRQAFATFGGPHILSLVTEVATRCLKAVRRQKYNYHRRARPERLGALLTLNAGALAGVVAESSLIAAPGPSSTIP